MQNHNSHRFLFKFLSLYLVQVNPSNELRTRLSSTIVLITMMDASTVTTNYLASVILLCCVCGSYTQGILVEGCGATHELAQIQSTNECIIVDSGMLLMQMILISSL